jgi:hypothetical protein
MKPFIAIFGLLALGAAAQDKTSPNVNFAFSPVMGKTIKGAPYSADEITESLQVLADGTRISHRSQATVYRDSQGRVRRESPTQITIFDPVAGVSYTLDPATMTAVKSNMGTLLMNRQKTFFFSARKVPRSEPATITVDGDAKARLDKLQAELAVQLDQAAAKLVATGGAEATETLGQQTIEGIIADGTRTTETIEAGAIGNDRPMHVVDERWFSSDLQTTVMTKHSDPRSGEEIFRLTNVQRSEPAAYLFVVPPDYKDVPNNDNRGAIVLPVVPAGYRLVWNLSPATNGEPGKDE